MKYISNFVYKNFPAIHPHCEMAYELAAKYLNCDDTIFSSLLLRLNDNIDEIVAIIEPKIPKELGLSFGSCYTSCGSVGITDVTVANFSINDDPLTLRTSFTTCGNTNLAVLIVPLEVSLVCTLALRATGIGHVWPTAEPGNDNVVSDHNLNVTGNILVSVPVYGTRYEFSRVRVDVMFSGNWSTTWPDTENILYNTVPLNEMSIKYMQRFNEAIRGQFSYKLQIALQAPDIINDCVFPTSIEAECNVTTRTASEFCSPCDTCCMCLMQQRCDGECGACECVECHDSKWYASMFLTMLFFFIVSGIIVWSFVTNRI